MQLEAVAAARRIKNTEAVVDTRADGAVGIGERTQREVSGEMTIEMAGRIRTLERTLAMEQWRRAGMLVSNQMCL